MVVFLLCFPYIYMLIYYYNEYFKAMPNTHLRSKDQHLCKLNHAARIPNYSCNELSSTA